MEEYLDIMACDLNIQRYNHEKGIGECKNSCSELCEWNNEYNFEDKLMKLLVGYCVEHNIKIISPSPIIKHFECIIAEYT